MKKEKVLEDNLKLEILMSTMNKTSLSFLDAIFPHHKLSSLHILIINQTETGKELNSDFENIRIINSYEKGLSKSRNLAIKNALGDICLIADDDIEYVEDFEKIIINGFQKFDNASVIRFKIDTFSGETYKAYPKHSKKLISKRDIESSSSIEIAFKREHIISNNIEFDPLFGLGSYFQSGEEYLFLKELLKSRLLIYFEDEFIVKHKAISSTSNIANEDFIRTQAALYYKDYGVLSYFSLFKFIIFLVRKRMIPSNKFLLKYKFGLQGIKSFIRLKNVQI